MLAAGPEEAAVPQARVPAEWEPGGIVGRYRIEAPLGSGGMGEVWRARDEALHRSVALKRLPPGAALDPERRARFLREARALAALDSPGIVVLYAAENVEDPDPFLDSYLVMELVEGTPLDAWLAGRGPLPVGEAVDLLRQVARALAEAHRAGVIHRDLKPGNVLRRPDGRVVVIDFGLALLSEGTEGNGRLTRSGMVAGTASYMAPEQARGEPLTAAADVWAAGVLLWEMLAGRHPFPGGSVLEQLAAILRDPVPPIEGSRPDVPGPVRRVLGACLAKDPAARPRDGAAFLAILPQEVLPLAARSQPLLAPEVLAEARAHAPLRPAVAHVALLAAFLGIASVAAVSWRSLAPAIRGGLRPPARAATVLDDLLEGLPQSERKGGFRAAGTAWLPGHGPILWARRSPESMLRPQGPIGPGHPQPGLDGDARAILDGDGTLLRWDWWPESAGGLPGPVAQLDRLARAAGAALPLVPEHPANASRRDDARSTLVDARGRRFVVVERGGLVTRFAHEGIGTPVGESDLLSPPRNAVWIALVAAVVLLVARNRRSSAWDLRGAVAFGAANAAIQLMKVVFNPITISSGIWLTVAVESLGHGFLCAAAYAAFEPFVRRAWPGALASWARLVTLRRADDQVGRELLLGSAATLPAGLVLHAAAFLPGRALGESWSFAALFGHEAPGLRLFILLDLLQVAFWIAGAGLLVAVPLLVVARRPAVALPLSLLAVSVAFLGVPPTTPAAVAAAVAIGAVLTGTVYAGGLVAVTTFLGVAALGLTSVPVGIGSWALLGSLAGPAFGVLLALLGWRLALGSGRPSSDTGRTVVVASSRPSVAARTASTAPLPEVPRGESPRLAREQRS